MADRPAWDLAAFAEVLQRSLHKMGLHLDREVAKESKRLGRDDVGCLRCRSGACCTSVLACTLYDGLPVALLLRRAGRDTPALRAELQRVGDLHHRLMLDDPEGLLQSEPCPLQGPDKRCTVYPARPLVCRAHVVWGDPEDCVRSGGHVRLLTSQLHKSLWLALGQAARWTEEKLALGRRGPYLGTLPRTVLTCLEALDASSLDAARALLRRAEGIPPPALERLANALGRQGLEEEDGG